MRPGIVTRTEIDLARTDAKPAMLVELLTTKEAARRLGVSVSQLYEWLRLSNVGALVIGGKAATIEYFQGGAKGQGRIRIAAAEVDRLIELTRVRQQTVSLRRPAIRRTVYPGITVNLGRPASK